MATARASRPLVLSVVLCLVPYASLNQFELTRHHYERSPLLVSSRDGRQFPRGVRPAASVSASAGYPRSTTEARTRHELALMAAASGGQLPRDIDDQGERSGQWSGLCLAK